MKCERTFPSSGNINTASGGNMMENPRIYDTLATKLWHLHLVDNALVSNNICIYAVYD